MFQTSRAYDLQHHLRVFEYYSYVLQPVRMILDMHSHTQYSHTRSASFQLLHSDSSCTGVGSNWQRVLQDTPFRFQYHLRIMFASLKTSWLDPVRSESGTTIVSLIDTCYVVAFEVFHLFNAGLTQY